MFELLEGFRWQDLIDILLVAFIIYRIFILIKGTRALKILVGLAIIVVAYWASREFELLALDWMLSTFLSSVILVVVVLFQNEIRLALAHVGMNPFLSAKDSSSSGAKVIEELMKASVGLANKRIGALIVIQRETDLSDYIEEGVKIDAILSKELLLSTFIPYSPIHDGAVIIRQGRVDLAGCFLPLTTIPDLDKNLGTRHRAALGLSEETDAVIIVVSEETGTISVVYDGKMQRGFDGAGLRKELLSLFPLGGGMIRKNLPGAASQTVGASAREEAKA